MQTEDVPRPDSGVRGGQKADTSRLERWSWTAQLVQVLLGILAFSATVLGVPLIIWQLRENSIIAWHTYLDERGAQLADRAQGNAVAACLFGFLLSREETGQLNEDCRNVIFESADNARSHLLYAEQMINYLREVDSFDYNAIPQGFQKRAAQILSGIGFDGLTSELGSWHAGLRSELADDPSGAVSFILVRWSCWREDGNLDAQVGCAEQEARSLGLCRPYNVCGGKEGDLACAILLRCAEAGSGERSISRSMKARQSCFEEDAERLGACVGPNDHCLCSVKLREKSNAFTNALRRPFPPASNKKDAP